MTPDKALPWYRLWLPRASDSTVAYILGIKIYRDRSRCLLVLIQSTYLDKVLKRFRMENSNKGNLPVMKGVSLSVTQCPAIAMEKSVMSDIPYASDIGSIM
jgi:hypothetical protein